MSRGLKALNKHSKLALLATDNISMNNDFVLIVLRFRQ